MYCSDKHYVQIYIYEQVSTAAKSKIILEVNIYIESTEHINPDLKPQFVKKILCHYTKNENPKSHNCAQYFVKRISVYFAQRQIPF